MRSTNDRISIAKAIAAGAAVHGGMPDSIADAEAAGYLSWVIANDIVSRAEAMRAEDAETARKEAEAAEGRRLQSLPSAGRRDAAREGDQRRLPNPHARGVRPATTT